jgi:hypothetical protein
VPSIFPDDILNCIALQADVVFPYPAINKFAVASLSVKQLLTVEIKCLT